MTITFGLSWDDYYDEENPEGDHDDFPSDLQEEEPDKDIDISGRGCDRYGSLG